MGRRKPTKITGKFFLRTDRKPDKNGKYAIYLDYTLGAKHAKTDTEVWIEEKFWDAEKREVSRKHPQCARLNHQLQKKRQDIDNAIYDYSQRSKGLITINTLRAIVQGRTVGNIADSDFVAYALETMEDRYKLGRIGVAVRDNARCSLNRFRKFLVETYGEDSIYVSELTVDIVKKYIFWRQRQGNINATINKSLTPIMKAAKRAAIDKLIDFSVAEAICQLYLSDKKEMGDDEDDVHYLTEEQVAEFVALRDKVKYPRTRDYMDMFLFSFNACGLRVSDIITLEWKSIDFETQKLKKVLYKGDKLHEIPLNDDAIKILENWYDRTGEHRFVFGLLDDSFNLQDKEERKRMRLNKNRAIQTSLNTIGDKMGLPFNLKMHVARHTFAVMALNKGVDIHKISQLMAHSSVSITEQIYAKFLPSALEEVVKEQLNFNFLNG